ncbi:MAG: CYTH domain-containing protein [Chloroflexi bacterium]|nr:CYTH domain-containing protein [Chloroflexota bacterium]
MPIEVEARFRADDALPLEALAATPRLGPGTLGPARTVDETDRYLDTEDGRLATALWACRLRSREGLTRISLKGPPRAGATPAWLHRRPEVEGPATDEIAPASWPASEALELLQTLSGGRALVERLRVRQRRTERPVALDEGPPIGTLTLDNVRLAAGDIDLGELFVVELEVDPASALDDVELADLAGALATVPGLVAEPCTKLERAMHRLRGRE